MAPIPTTVKKFRSFLGLMGYYHRLVKHYADKFAAMHSKTSGKGPIEWNPEVNISFEKIHVALTSTPVL